MRKNYHQLTIDERTVIQTLLQEKRNKSYIAKRLHRDPSTIGREIERNSGGRGYFAKAAQCKTNDRNKIERQRKMTPDICNYVNMKLAEKYSPEQITFNILEDTGVSLSYETIYKYIYDDKLNGGLLYKDLRLNHKKIKYRKRNKAAWRTAIPNRTDISERPVVVEKRVRYGDWEADLMNGRDQKHFLVTLTERKSLYTLAGKIPNKFAKTVSKKIIEMLAPYRKRVHTLTYDNGTEFVCHEEVNEALECRSFFAAPFHPWERGTNENANGLIRQYLPRGTDFRLIEESYIAEMIKELNSRPRKSRCKRRPDELIFRSLHWGNNKSKFCT